MSNHVHNPSYPAEPVARSAAPTGATAHCGRHRPVHWRVAGRDPAFDPSGHFADLRIGRTVYARPEQIDAALKEIERQQEVAIVECTRAQ